MLGDLLGGIALTERVTGEEGPGPDEIMALNAEYHDNQLWEEKYSLYDSGTKAQVPFEAYAARSGEVVSAIVDYSFPSVEIRGDTAEVTRVYGFETESNHEDRREVQPLIREDGQWRIVLTPEQLAFYTSASSASAGATAE